MALEFNESEADRPHYIGSPTNGKNIAKNFKWIIVRLDPKPCWKKEETRSKI